jgi:hypothetical protein
MHSFLRGFLRLDGLKTARLSFRWLALILFDYAGHPAQRRVLAEHASTEPCHTHSQALLAPINGVTGNVADPAAAFIYLVLDRNTMPGDRPTASFSLLARQNLKSYLGKRKFKRAPPGFLGASMACGVVPWFVPQPPLALQSLPLSLSGGDRLSNW